MDKTRLVVGIAGNITSILLYSAPIITFKRVIKKRSTEEFSCVPYVVTLLAALLYLWYGLPVVSYKGENLTVITICAIGAVLESVFVLIYIWFASSRRKRILAILMVVAVVVMVSIITLVSTYAMHDRRQRKIFVGSIGVVVAIGMYSAPLVVMKQVIQTKSVEFMPFYLSLFSFLNSSLWGLYGLVGHELFVGLPNVLGIPLGLLQLLLYCCYWKRKVHKAPDVDLEKNGEKNQFQQSMTDKE